MGVISNIRGILFARPRGLHPDEIVQKPNEIRGLAVVMPIRGAGP
jgi:hypothetical protein